MPRRPSSTAFFTNFQAGLNLNWNMPEHLTPASSQAFRMSSMRSIVISMGFSINTCLPDLAAATARSRLAPDGVMMETASMSFLFMTSYGSLYISHLNSSPMDFTLSASGQATAKRCASGIDEMASRCMRDMAPQPMTAKVRGIGKPPFYCKLTQL